MTTENEIAEKYNICLCSASNLIRLLQVCDQLFLKTKEYEDIRQNLIKIIVGGDNKTKKLLKIQSWPAS